MSAPKDPKKYALWKLRSKEGHKGQIPWNVGLTAETDERVKRNAEALKGKKCWCKGLTNKTDNRVKKRSKAISKALTGKHPTAETIKKLRKSHLGLPSGMKGKHHTEESKKMMGKGCRGLPGHMKGKHHTERANKKNSKTNKKRWVEASEEQRKVWVEAILHASHIKPNKAELRLFSILQKHFPGDYALNVKAEIMILGGKIPDFVNVNGAKNCIELWGDYWHKGQDPQDRINYFKRFGYNTLIIWEHELLNENLLFQKLTRFKFVRRKHSHCRNQK